MGCDPKPKRWKLSIPPNSSTIYCKVIDQRFRIFLFLVGSIRSMAWGSRPLYKLGVSYFPPSIEIHKPCLSTSWRRRAWPSKGSNIAIRPSPINHRVCIQTSPPCRFWVPKSHLQTSNSNTQNPKTSNEMEKNKIKINPYMREREGHTNPYPLDLPEALSVMMTASRISPNCSKYLLISSVGVSQANPPTKTFVRVVSPNCDR